MCSFSSTIKETIETRYDSLHENMVSLMVENALLSISRKVLNSFFKQRQHLVVLGGGGIGT